MADELKTIKFQLMLAPGEAEAIDDWGFKHRIRTRAEAMRRLCQIGMAYEEKSAEFAENAASGINITSSLFSQIAEAEGDPVKLVPLYEEIISRYHHLMDAVFLPLILLNKFVQGLTEQKNIPSAIEHAKENIRLISEMMAGWRERENARLEEKHGDGTPSSDSR